MYLRRSTCTACTAICPYKSVRQNRFAELAERHRGNASHLSSMWMTMDIPISAMIDGIYTGPVKEGVRHGEGRIDWDNGDSYEGHFENGLRSGHGVLTEPKLKRRYEGNWKMSQRHGHGTQAFGNGDHYIGDFANDKFHGRGELTTNNGRYDGEFRDGLRHGFGIMAFKHSCRYEGQWAFGRMDGKGLYIWTDGTRYEGQWVKGERTGEGVLSLPSGEKYDGTFLHNKKHGSGWWRFTNGKVRPGEWKDDIHVKWTGPEQYEAQMKAKKLKNKMSNSQQKGS